MDNILAKLMGRPSMGTGMVEQAAQILQSRPYQLHVQEAQAMGQQPMSPQDFAVQYQAQKQKLPALMQQ